MLSFNIIVAVDQKNGIGKAGKLPWHLPEDLRHFKQITTSAQPSSKQNAVIMGRKTWESIPEKFRPLSNRANIVISKNENLKLPDGVMRANSLQEALEQLKGEGLADKLGEIYVIGGQQVYQEAIQSPQCQKIFLTHILTVFDCDAFFPPFQDQFEKTSSSPIHQTDSLQYYFAEYIRKK